MQILNFGQCEQQVDLVKVPNKDVNWKLSLTPHKACDRFDKGTGKAERDAFAEMYTEGIIARMRDNLPGWNWNWTDIVAMQQLCGKFCNASDARRTCLKVSDHRLRNSHSGFIRVLYALRSERMGTLGVHGRPLLLLHARQTQQVDCNSGKSLLRNLVCEKVPNLRQLQGIPWIQNALHHLNNTATAPISQEISEMDLTSNMADLRTSPLPKPTKGPNATLAQALQIWFTHREEVPIVTHALDLFHGHTDEEAEMPLDRINYNRAWRTSEIIPFLGHVALERLQCDVEVVSQTSHKKKKGKKGKKGRKGRKPEPPTFPPNTKAFVRIVVNGSPQQQPDCHDGPGGSCSLDDFIRLVEELPAKYGDLEKVCDKQD